MSRNATDAKERRVVDDLSLGQFDQGGRSHWIRLRTLIVLRWVAITGQISAIAVAQQFYGLDLELGLAYLVIGTAIMANLIAIFVYPENRRLSEREALLTLIFDLSQLAALLYLTGGINNPFALLILTPVVIAATTLELRSVLIIGGTAVGLISVIAFFYVPLQTADGSVLQIPDLFVFGFWISIVIGVAFLALYARRVSLEVHAMSDALLATQMALAREQKLTDLGGVVAAAAHELGTPLATIKLVSTELREELMALDDASPHLLEDVDLVNEQAERCREILRSMGRVGKDDRHMRFAPLEAVIKEAAEPHQDRGKIIHFDVSPLGDGDFRQPTIRRHAEIIHGLRNLVQNAVDFAAGHVWVDARWSDDTVSIRIVDDGAGFPPQLLGRIGDPFVRTRKSGSEKTKRPEYEGMGLGLFIAKTLLERSGGELTFANAADPFLPETDKPEKRGALVEVTWSRDTLVSEGRTRAEGDGLGENTPIEI